jgi:hypothetical protein
MRIGCGSDADKMPTSAFFADKCGHMRTHADQNADTCGQTRTKTFPHRYPLSTNSRSSYGTYLRINFEKKSIPRDTLRHTCNFQPPDELTI